MDKGRILEQFTDLSSRICPGLVIAAAMFFVSVTTADVV